MSDVTFHVPGQPVPKGRPKFARRGAHVTTYTPEKTQVYENLIKTAAAEAMAGRAPFARPVRLDVCIALQIPGSWSKKRHAMAVAGLIGATKKPDADNILKAVKDAVNQVVWNDDSQVILITVFKKYGLTPGITVNVDESSLEAA